MKAKKSLGQNFFVNKNLAENIVETVLESAPTDLLEIGPGKGSFTLLFRKRLSDENIVLIEKDNELAAKWKSFYPEITVINKDVLNVNVGLQLQSGENRTVSFGSLPFNQSKRIIKKMLLDTVIKNHYYIIQKEVAQKYCEYKSTDKKESNSLGITTKYIAEAKRIRDISPGSFRPIPKVYSSLIMFERKDFELEDYRRFTDFVYDCFRYPRKMLKNNLKGTEWFDKVFIDKRSSKSLQRVRPGSLDYDDYVEIFKNID